MWFQIEYDCLPDSGECSDSIEADTEEEAIERFRNINPLHYISAIDGWPYDDPRRPKVTKQE